MTMAKKTHGKTASGVPITNELVAELARRPRLATTSTRWCAGEAASHIENMRSA